MVEPSVVYCLCIDMIGSTEAGLQYSTQDFDKFNSALVQQIEPHWVAFNLDLDRTLVKFTGDGWLLMTDRPAMVFALCNVALRMASRFRLDMVELTGLNESRIPHLRLALCSGRDIPVELPTKQNDWVGDSARRANRASKLCNPDEILVDQGVRDAVVRDFDFEELPKEQHEHAEKKEEYFPLYILRRPKDAFVAPRLESFSDYGGGSWSFITMMQALPEPWQPTNHSYYRIFLKTVLDPQWLTEIKQAVRQYFGKYVDQIVAIKQVDEDSGSLNFKIECKDKPPILFRINKRIRDLDNLNASEALNALEGLGGYFHQQGVLPHSTARDAIVPLVPSSQRPQGCSGMMGFNAYLSAYRWVDGEHYSGRTESELHSIAEEFGRFQKALAELNTKATNINLGAIEQLRADLKYHAAHPRDKYRELRATYVRAPSTGTILDIPDGLLRNADEIISRAVETLASADHIYEKRNEVGQTASYADLHPHNTLMRDGWCVLIYDYESCIPLATQEVSLGFALHRFTREWIIKNGFASVQERARIQERARRGMTIFLNGYSSFGASVPTGFEARLAAIIRWVNLHKLFYLADIFNRKGSDLSGRQPSTLWNEMRKFIAYIREADAYELDDVR